MDTAINQSTAEFLKRSGIDEIVAELSSHLSKKGEPFRISDVTDFNGNQYVDLVQEGGGVLGIALVGYTYVLEKMGIRFFSMAGTSAGSINAMLLACAGNKEDEKSTRIIEKLVALDMFSFVDGQPENFKFTRWLKKKIQQLLLGGKAFRRMMVTLKWSFIILLVLTVGCFVINFFWPGIARWVGLAAGITLLLISVVVMFFVQRFRLFAKNGYGLNEGKVFQNWIREVISSFHVEDDPAQRRIQNYEDFSHHFMRVPELTVHPDPQRTNNHPPFMPMLTLITCDITSGRKIEFTRMWDLYWATEKDVHPGDFVRASMSIPVFFESFSVTGIRKNSSFETWDRHLNWQNEKKAIPDRVKFIDGGTLSNFPINVFYNPNYPVPRMPTFGIRLQDGVLDPANKEGKGLGNYIMSLFSAIRFNFDRDFITKNRAYTLGVKNIDVREHNWLNFFMKEEEKIALFRKGALAAAEFLKSFNWEHYKSERLRNHLMSEEKFDNPNNMRAQPHSGEFKIG
jgi:NTE family protein